MSTTVVNMGDVDNTAKPFLVGLSASNRPVTIHRVPRMQAVRIVLEGGGAQPPEFEGVFSFPQALITAQRWVNDKGREMDDYPLKDLI